MKSVPQLSRRRPVQVVEEESDEEFEDDEFEDDEFDEEEDDDDEGELGELMEAYLSHEDDNVCSAMLKVAKQLETTNRLLVKMLASQAPPPSPQKRPRSRSVVHGSASSSEVEAEAVDLTTPEDEE